MNVEGAPGAEMARRAVAAAIAAEQQGPLGLSEVPVTAGADDESAAAGAQAAPESGPSGKEYPSAAGGPAPRAPGGAALAAAEEQSGSSAPPEPPTPPHGEGESEEAVAHVAHASASTVRALVSATQLLLRTLRLLAGAGARRNRELVQVRRRPRRARGRSAITRASPQRIR